MAEPIRKTALPVHRRPQGTRPHPRLRPNPWVADETAPEPIPQKARAATPGPRPALLPAPAPPEESAPAVPSAAVEIARPRSETFKPASERKLRSFLQIALGLHAAAVAWIFLFPSAGQSSSLSEMLLAAVVLLAGGTVLAFGAFGRR